MQTLSNIAETVIRFKFNADKNNLRFETLMQNTSTTRDWKLCCIMQSEFLFKSHYYKRLGCASTYRN